MRPVQNFFHFIVSYSKDECATYIFQYGSASSEGAPQSKLSHKTSFGVLILMSLQLIQSRRTMIRKETAQVHFKQNLGSQEQFLTDPKSDIFVVFQDKIIPLHRRVVAPCSYFQNKDFNCQRVFFLDQTLEQYMPSTEISSLLKVLGSLYGLPMDFVRSNEGVQIFQWSKFLGIGKLQSFFFEDFDKNFEEYGVFLLYYVAKKFQIRWLQQKCLKDLINCSFEQFFINKYDLMNSDKETFQQIMKHHQVLKSKGYTQGQPENKLKVLIQEYQSINQTQVDIEEVLSLTTEDEELTEKAISDIAESKKGIKKAQSIRRRQSTWNCSNDSQKNHPSSVKVELTVKKGISKVSSQNSSESEQKALELRQINSDLMKRSTTMLSEIKEVQIKTRNSDLSQERRIQRLDKNLNQIASIFQKQQQKITKAQSIIKEMTSLGKTIRF